MVQTDRLLVDIASSKHSATSMQHLHHTQWSHRLGHHLKDMLELRHTGVYLDRHTLAIEGLSGLGRTSCRNNTEQERLHRQAKGKKEESEERIVCYMRMSDTEKRAWFLKDLSKRRCSSEYIFQPLTPTLDPPVMQIISRMPLMLARMECIRCTRASGTGIPREGHEHRGSRDVFRLSPRRLYMNQSSRKRCSTRRCWWNCTGLKLSGSCGSSGPPFVSS